MTYDALPVKLAIPSIRKVMVRRLKVTTMATFFLRPTRLGKGVNVRTIAESEQTTHRKITVRKEYMMK